MNKLSGKNFGRLQYQKLMRRLCSGDVLVIKAEPLSVESFDEAREGGARIVYAVGSGWRIVPVGETGNEGTVLREVFQGQLSDYEFVPANVVRMRVKYQYSNTGGLAGIDAAAPGIVEAEARLEKTSGKYELEFPLPEVKGFRVVLAPAPLNKYLVTQPTGNETAEELREMLERGDFSVDIANHSVYAYQEKHGIDSAPDYTILSETYGNRYSTEYNRVWNDARILQTEDYTAQAYCGSDTHAGHEIGNHGANALVKPKLKVTLTEEQLKNALENGLNINVSYRRNATWYTVNHWVPKDLSGLTEDELQNRKIKEENGVPYVLLNTENLQGRVGGLTRAAAKTEGVYTLLAPLVFNQKLIENRVSNDGVIGTVVDIYYRAADSYRVIFDTDYTYIPRQQVPLGEYVKFAGMAEPQRKGYTFAGWQYLNQGAQPDENGEYDETAYTPLEKDGSGVYTLKITSELLTQNAKLQETAGVLALHLYPRWEPNTTQITVILWTEDLDGLTDVQAKVTGGTSEYYTEKYKPFQDPVTSKEPQLGSVGSNSNYSNVGSFTMTVDTDSSLEGTPDGDRKSLREDIQAQVTEHFKTSARDINGTDASQFYAQYGF
ncbi:hypothetical protein [uncultured Dysosmobacter sp.]|uniref:hypothetical protein n=1 Tax=uncultured Dysosmobacter sp. TaxID=2591384 RepID=UPI00262990BA|nr:hypothetical protein [uncultured Dysosmobacter sp.]